MTNKFVNSKPIRVRVYEERKCIAIVHALSNFELSEHTVRAPPSLSSSATLAIADLAYFSFFFPFSLVSNNRF